MNPNTFVNNFKNDLEKIKNSYIEDLGKVQVGRANPKILEGIMVEAYGGTKMNLQQLGLISVVDANMLQITPYDQSVIANITNAIRANQNLGLNPSDDGHVIRIAIPPLTEERRKQLVKEVNSQLELALIKARNTRHDLLKDLDNKKKLKEVSDDELKRIQKLIDGAFQEFKLSLDTLTSTKQATIMHV